MVGAGVVLDTTASHVSIVSSSACDQAADATTDGTLQYLLPSLSPPFPWLA